MDIPLRVLIVEDSEDDTTLLVRELRRGGYDVTFERVDTAKALSAMLERQEWDLVIADYSMPAFSGVAALHQVKESGIDVPFIFVSGTIGEETAVKALQAGAHDYVMKDRFGRLVPAVERELRQARTRRERHRAEEAFQQSEARYRALVENAIYGIFWSSLEAKFLDVNPALVRMLGYSSKEEVLSLNLATDLYRDPAERARIVEQFRYLDRFEGIEVEWKRKDGKRLIVRLSGRAVRDSSGQIESFEVIAEDVSEPRALQKQVASLQKFEAIGRLAGGIAHDFNNVLGAIMGWAELGLTQAPSESNLRRHFQKIHDQSLRAAALTRQLLAFARRQILEPRNINLNQCISELLGLLEKVIAEDIEVRTVLQPDLRLTRADAAQVEQVLMNLCLNARDAMPHGGRLIIETRNEHIDEDYCRMNPHVSPDDYVVLAVSDTGTGIDAKTMEHIFEPFFTTKEMSKGTGLGLATVYGIVNQHNGFVNVYSEPGRGTTFRVYLPAATGSAEAQEKPQESPARRGTETILLAEDHEGMRELAKETLEKLGYRMLLAADGEDAVRIFEANPGRVSLVVLDVVMPKLTGPKAYARILAAGPGVPVIFTTGYSTEMDLLDELEGLEGVEILQKPYRTKVLADRIRALLDR